MALKIGATKVHSFYYGYRSGLVVAVVCAAIYLLACLPVSVIEPIDFLLRVSFLFLIALPIGLLSAILRKDKERIESLNRDLNESLETMKHLTWRSAFRRKPRKKSTQRLSSTKWRGSNGSFGTR